MVFALETIVENFGSEMAPFAVGLCQHLSQAFWRLQASQALPTHDWACAHTPERTIGIGWLGIKLLCTSMGLVQQCVSNHAAGWTS